MMNDVVESEIRISVVDDSLCFLVTVGRAFCAYMTGSRILCVLCSSKMSRTVGTLCSQWLVKRNLLFFDDCVCCWKVVL